MYSQLKPVINIIFSIYFFLDFDFLKDLNRCNFEHDNNFQLNIPNRSDS